MDNEEYWKRYYKGKFESSDVIELTKSTGGDWSNFSITQGGFNSSFSLKSKEDAEALHFMLGQMLGKNE